MNSPRLPYNGQQILELRQKGKRPADMVLVSMVGWLGELNPCVLAVPGKAYEWRFLTDLDVLLVVDTRIAREQVKAAVAAILEHSPSYLGLWFSDKQDGFHVAWGDYRPRIKSICRMGFYDKQKCNGIGAKK